MKINKNLLAISFVAIFASVNTYATQNIQKAKQLIKEDKHEKAVEILNLVKNTNKKQYTKAKYLKGIAYRELHKKEVREKSNSKKLDYYFAKSAENFFFVANKQNLNKKLKAKALYQLGIFCQHCKTDSKNQHLIYLNQAAKLAKKIGLYKTAILANYEIISKSNNLLYNFNDTVSGYTANICNEILKLLSKLRQSISANTKKDYNIQFIEGFCYCSLGIFYEEKSKKEKAKKYLKKLEDIDTSKENKNLRKVDLDTLERTQALKMGAYAKLSEKNLTKTKKERFENFKNFQHSANKFNEKQKKSSNQKVPYEDQIIDVIKVSLAALEKRNKQKYLCSTCKKETHTCKHCGRCKKVYYCSKACQIQNWSAHKKVCKK